MSTFKHGSCLVFDESDLNSTVMSDITEFGGFVDFFVRNSTESFCSKDAYSSCEPSGDKYKCKTSIIESRKLVLKHDAPFASAGFDLNEEIDIDNSVICVMAKAAPCIGKPTMPLKFEGAMEWKSFAETSAFRPAMHSKVHFSGIDLNVAALEDGSQAKSLCIDLNYPFDAAD